MRKASDFSSLQNSKSEITFNCVEGPVMLKRDPSREEEEEKDDVEEYAIHDPNDEYKLSFMRRKRPIKVDEESVAEGSTLSSSNQISLQQKNINQLRMNLMAKLASNGVWAPMAIKAVTHQTIIIFDWDDTLMASTFLQPYQSQIMQENVRNKLPKLVKEQLETLEVQVIQLLKKSLKGGQTLIITNAG